MDLNKRREALDENKEYVKERQSFRNLLRKKKDLEGHLEKEKPNQRNKRISAGNVAQLATQ